MKKIATMLGGSLAIATLPVAGVFAATGTTVIDTVEVTINSSCLITATNMTNSYSATMTNSQLKSDIGGTSMSVSCNDAAGWEIHAVGSNGTGSDKNKMLPTGSDTAIAAGTATSGATSNWAFKVTGTDANGATTFTAVPSTALKVAKKTASTSSSTLTATYQVWISATQQADTYTGKITYTLSHPATS